MATYHMEGRSKSDGATFICIALNIVILQNPLPQQLYPICVLESGQSSSSCVWWGKQKKCDESKERFGGEERTSLKF